MEELESILEMDYVIKGEFFSERFCEMEISRFSVFLIGLDRFREIGRESGIVCDGLRLCRVLCLGSFRFLIAVN